MIAEAVTDSAFAVFQELLRCRTGFVLEDDKRYVVEMRLAPLMRRFELASFDQLTDRMRSGRSAVTEQMVIEALLNGETTFFRDVACFASLENTVIPEIMRRRASTRRIRIWCAASSTGQEPYSIAMMLASSFPQLEGWDVRILATDYSELHLERARAGRYSQFEVNRGLPARMLVQHFAQEGNEWIISPDIRRRVEFAPMNLVGDWKVPEPVDLIMLRNVMIYWDPPTQRAVLGRVGEAIGRSGFLVLGGAETTYYIAPEYDRYGENGSCCFVLT